MTFRENINAILHYENFDRMPIVSFGYWDETLQKWAQEGHITKEEAEGYARFGDNSQADKSVMKRLGFDFNWNSCFEMNTGLSPAFEQVVLEEYENKSLKIRDSQGLIVLIKPGVVSIPAEIGTTLVDRKAWEKEYLPKLQWSEERVNNERLKVLANSEKRELPVGLHCGSLIGYMRNLLGVEQLSYLYADDEELFAEIVDTIADISYKCTEKALKSGVKLK